MPLVFNPLYWWRSGGPKLFKGLFMLTRLKLLQTKYNLSNEFMANAIRSEIERQAMLDIRGIVNNGSIALLDGIISDFTPTVVDTPPITDNSDPRHNPHYTEMEIKKNTGIDTFISTAALPVKPKGKRRG